MFQTQKLRKLLGIGSVLFVTSIIFFFHIISSYNFDSDFGRDINDIYSIANGNITLLGPKSSFGGIFTTPYYYYLFVPILLLSKFNWEGILYFNAFLFSCAIAYIWYLLHEKYGVIKASLAALSITLLPVVLISARNPGNAYTYIPLLMCFITSIAQQKIESKKVLIVLGLVGGVLIGTHYSNVVPVILLFIFIGFFQKKKGNILFLLAGFISAFAPLILFELKHTFIMFRNTFIDKSFSAFTENKNLAATSQQSNNLFKNMLFINNEMMKVITMPAILYVAINAFITKNIKNNRIKLLLIPAVLSVIFVIIFFLKFQYAQFYLYPVGVLLFLSTLFIILETCQWKILLVVIAFQIITFPLYLYQPSQRKAEKFEKAVNYVIEQKIVDNDRSFNVMQIRPDVSITPYGFEYRYFLRKQGYEPQLVTEYNTSDSLIIFSEIPDLNVEKISNWEIEQFGKQYLKNVQKYSYNDISIYKITK
ncbi:MAG: hypothetical protein H0U27_02260 [Nitrosopumilus sp.]|nr:hypothetical protein [Nitrosopumilus sp.]MBA3551152.1 hypothetical protein [Patescibacteria group bacterium]